MSTTYDLVIAGGGVIGCAVARAALRRNPKLRLLLLERERRLAVHQSGRNSGVVHAGYNQKPGTTKAKFVVSGSRMLREFCQEHQVPLIQNGIVVVAHNSQQEQVLVELYRRGTENGSQVELIDTQRLSLLEPHAPGESALYAPEGASFNAVAFVEAIAHDVRDLGGQISNGVELMWSDENHDGISLYTSAGALKTRKLINAGGLQADRIAHPLGVGLDYKIVPFRGQYHQLKDNRRFLVRSHVYAAPDLNFPFLGVHFSRTYDGRVTIGPGAVLAPGREAYERGDFDWRDCSDMLMFNGFWRMFKNEQFLSMAANEWRKSFFDSAVYSEAKTLIPELQMQDLEPYRAGIRAQLVHTSGQLIDDLVIEQTPLSLHVLNAVSPALTCSLPFADHVVSLAFAE